jgi:hypothetical protein
MVKGLQGITGLGVYGLRVILITKIRFSKLGFRVMIFRGFKVEDLGFKDRV